MEKWTKLMDKAQSIDNKNGVICLGVMVIKMSKMPHFYFLLMATKN